MDVEDVSSSSSIPVCDQGENGSNSGGGGGGGGSSSSSSSGGGDGGKKEERNRNKDELENNDLMEMQTDGTEEKEEKKEETSFVIPRDLKRRYEEGESAMKPSKTELQILNELAHVTGDLENLNKSRERWTDLEKKSASHEKTNRWLKQKGDIAQENELALKETQNQKELRRRKGNHNQTETAKGGGETNKSKWIPGNGRNSRGLNGKWTHGRRASSCGHQQVHTGCTPPTQQAQRTWNRR